MKSRISLGRSSNVQKIGGTEKTRDQDGSTFGDRGWR